MVTQVWFGRQELIGIGTKKFLQGYGQYYREQQKEQCHACKLNFLFVEKQLRHSIEVIDKEKTQKQKGLDEVNSKRTL